MGEYNYYIACRDGDYISRAKEIKFNLVIDNTPPIPQFYTEGNLFKVRLNEKGECYVKQGEIFVKMTSDTAGIVHSTPASAKKSYEVRCKDLWNNWVPGESTAISVSY